MESESCKLCLKYIQGEDLASLDEAILGKLEFLQMDLDQSVEESNSLCIDCEEKISNAFVFKSCIVQNEHTATSETESQQQNGDTPSTSTGEMSAEKTTCHLCRTTVDKICVISLFKLLKDDSMMDVFQGHIPEVKLNDTENAMVCEACQKSLASYSTLVASWSIANDWNDDEDTKDDMQDFEVSEVKKEDYGDDQFSDSNTNSSCAFEVSDSNSATKSFTTKKGKGKRVQTISAAGSSNSKKIKTEIDEISDSSESVTLTNKGIKKEAEENEELEDIDNLQLKSEEIDIKNEDDEGKRGNKTHKKDHFKGHLQSHRSQDLLVHKSSEEHHKLMKQLATFKCLVCTYQTKRKCDLKRHSIVHKTIGIRQKEESFRFSCQQCPYKSTKKYNFQKHLLVHKTSEERQKLMEQLATFKCLECKYTTKRKFDLKRHSIVHKTIHIRQKEERFRFSCQQCPYKSIKKYNLQKNLLVHESSEERQKLMEQMPIFECPQCAYKTKKKM